MGKKVIGGGGVEMIKMMMVMLMCAFTVSSLLMTMMVPCVVDAAAASRKSFMYRVGDSDKGWRPELNYTDWASKHHFYVGDWLYFGYDRNMYDVLEVNQKDYEACRSDHPIANISRGAGRDVFNLTSAKPFYFLSSTGGYCFQGMRVVVTVEEFSDAANITAPAPSPSPSKNGSSTFCSRNGVISILIGAIVVAWTLVLNV